MFASENTALLSSIAPMKRYLVTLRYVSGPTPIAPLWVTEVLAHDTYDAVAETRRTGYELVSIEKISL